MTKRNIHSDELAVDTSDNELYRRNPDGTYSQITVGGAALVTDAAVGAQEMREFTLTGATLPTGKVRLDFGSNRVKAVKISIQRLTGTTVGRLFWTPGNPPNTAAGDAALTAPAAGTEAAQRRMVPVSSVVGECAEDKLTWSEPVQYIEFGFEDAAADTLKVSVAAALEVT
jgi:hypothetical protein